MASSKTQNYAYWWVAYERDLTAGGSIDYDYGVFAAQKVIEAATLAVNQIADGRSSLLEIMLILRTGLLAYYTGRRLAIEGERSFWHVLTAEGNTNTGYPLKSPDPTNADWLAKVASIQAEVDSLKVQLLRDANFIKANATHGWETEVISVDDGEMAYNLYLTVRTAIKNLIITRATAYRDSLVANQAALQLTEDSLTGFIRPYLL
jgi:hypothetical protein